MSDYPKYTGLPYDLMYDDDDVSVEQFVAMLEKTDCPDWTFIWSLTLDDLRDAANQTIDEHLASW